MWTLTTDKDWKHVRAQFDWVRDMEGVPQDPVHHAEGDVAIHTKMVLRELEQLELYRQLPEQDRNLLWAAALLHDVEKRSTTVTEPLPIRTLLLAFTIAPLPIAVALLGLSPTVKSAL